MKRRNFLKLTGPMAFTPLVMNGSVVRPYISRSLASFFSCDEVNDRHLVVLQIKGGNDGLNCIIPINQYDKYKSFRPKIGLNYNDLVNLDTTLSLDNQVGLHPELTSLKALYERDEFSFIQGVGYENSNKSHFKGTDIWLSGGDSTAANYNISSGWIGRYLDNSFPDLAGEPTVDFPDPLGIQLGSRQQTLGFHTEEQHEAGINLSGQDPAGFYTLVSEIGGLPPSHIDVSDYGRNIEYIIDIEQSTNRYAERISEVFNSGSNAVTYPDYDLANQLKTVARLIQGGIRTKIFIVTIGGFDTHDNQAEVNNPTTGTHAGLLRHMSESVLAFQNDLNALGLADRVAGVSFSEFGRRPKENDGAGTDHGTIAPMFLFGKHIKSQVLGTNVDLSLVGGDANDLVGLQTDYRSVFTALLQDWLGASDAVITNTLFEEFLSNKSNIIDTSAIVAPECYVDSFLKKKYLDNMVQLNCYPNPAQSMLYFPIQSSLNTTGHLSVMDVSGNVFVRTNVQINYGENNCALPVSNLMPGNYILKIQFSDSKKQYAGRFIKL